jgi:hypothetical protein
MKDVMKSVIVGLQNIVSYAISDENSFGAL